MQTIIVVLIIMFKSITKAASFVGYIFHCGCVAHCTFEYLGDFVVCSGPSMEPTLYTNNVLLTERIGKQFNRFNRGDIIVAKSPIKPEQYICKRIVGLPGDKIYLKPRINFNPFDNAKSIVMTEVETFTNDHTVISTDSIDNWDDKKTHLNNQEMSMRTFQSKVVHVPKGHVWLEGDNFENSSDSRTYGPVPIGMIQSRIFCRLWPIEEMKLFLKI